MNRFQDSDPNLPAKKTFIVSDELCTFAAMFPLERELFSSNCAFLPYLED